MLYSKCYVLQHDWQRAAERTHFALSYSGETLPDGSKVFVHGENGYRATKSNEGWVFSDPSSGLDPLKQFLDSNVRVGWLIFCSITSLIFQTF